MAVYIFLVYAVQCRACLSQFPNLQDILCEGAFGFLLLCQANATVAMAMAMFESALSPLSCYFFLHARSSCRGLKSRQRVCGESSAPSLVYLFIMYNKAVWQFHR